MLEKPTPYSINKPKSKTAAAASRSVAAQTRTPELSIAVLRAEDACIDWSLAWMGFD
jgi:hypothetical protein